MRVASWHRELSTAPSISKDTILFPFLFSPLLKGMYSSSYVIRKVVDDSTRVVHVTSVAYLTLLVNPVLHRCSACYFPKSAFLRLNVNKVNIFGLFGGNLGLWDIPLMSKNYYNNANTVSFQ